jgi:ABC-2 type transport system ATP-binding protein
MLQITNYKKAYGSQPVLAIPQLQLTGGIYWLKGENGAGKTTLLKSVAGLIPFEGEMVVDNIPLRKQRMLYTRKVAFAEAEPVYPLFLTGSELIRFYEETKGKNKIVTNRLINDLGMQSYLANKVSTYSSGMLKKLSLLLAFTGDSTLILFDEPFITLDADAVKVIQELIADCYWKEISFIISSHQVLEISVPYNTLSVQQQTIQQENNVGVAE